MAMRPRSEQSEQPIKTRYLRALSELGTLTAGCKAARVSPHTIYKWRDEDEAFAEEEAQAREACADGLEEALVRRAKRKSDVAAIFMLKAMRPEKYRETINLNVNVRQQAEKIAAELGLDPAEVIAEAERLIGTAKAA